MTIVCKLRSWGGSSAVMYHLLVNMMHGICWSLESALDIQGFQYLCLVFWVPVTLAGMDYADPKKKSSFVGKMILVAFLTVSCIFLLKGSTSFNSPSPVTPFSYIWMPFSMTSTLLCWSDFILFYIININACIHLLHVYNHIFNPMSSSMLKYLSISHLAVMP